MSSNVATARRTVAARVRRVRRVLLAAFARLWSHLLPKVASVDPSAYHVARVRIEARRIEHEAWMAEPVSRKRQAAIAERIRTGYSRISSRKLLPFELVPRRRANGEE